jgi:hypothetical protein
LEPQREFSALTPWRRFEHGHSRAQEYLRAFNEDRLKNSGENKGDFLSSKCFYGDEIASEHTPIFLMQDKPLHSSLSASEGKVDLPSYSYSGERWLKT